MGESARPRHALGLKPSGSARGPLLPLVSALVLLFVSVGSLVGSGQPALRSSPLPQRRRSYDRVHPYWPARHPDRAAPAVAGIPRPARSTTTRPAPRPQAAAPLRRRTGRRPRPAAEVAAPLHRPRPARRRSRIPPRGQPAPMAGGPKRPDAVPAESPPAPPRKPVPGATPVGAATPGSAPGKLPAKPAPAGPATQTCGPPGAPCAPVAPLPAPGTKQTTSDPAAQQQCELTAACPKVKPSPSDSGSSDLAATPTAEKWKLGGRQRRCPPAPAPIPAPGQPTVGGGGSDLHSPDFVVHPNGEAVIVPKGATGPRPADTGLRR
jgi:hypothetical protein